MKKILIINGPNLNLIGKREKKIYGNKNIFYYLKKLKKNFFKKNIKILFTFLNCEGEIINLLQKLYIKNKNLLGLIINVGAFSHTSLAISDTLKYIKKKIKIVEVHISNIFKREKIRHKSLISTYTNGIILGFGLKVYYLGIISLL
ncbi:MAG: 3-dehydroquinate dehydratase [Candidatus Shikimatogenerans sp. JK-2022]|nr:3-dehydroquinate dehydratase [Candidatus Shikimatogenerans bostrichidophilus]